MTKKSFVAEVTFKGLKCQVPFVGKSETRFNIRLSTHRKDVPRKESIPASNHFNIEGHNFNSHTKFILIEQVNLFSINVPFRDQPGSWFLLATCLKNTCGKVTF